MGGKAYVDRNGFEAPTVEGEPDSRNNYNDLALIKELYPDFNEFGDVDEWIDAWGSNAATQESFMMKVYCLSHAAKLGVSAAVLQILPSCTEKTNLVRLF